MDKIIGKTLAEMVVPEDELWHIYGTLPHAYDVWHHTCAKFSDNPDIFAGLGTGKRSDAVQASVFDMIHAEILGEHNAEKARVRNRRKNDRKAKRKSGAYVKRNGGDWRKDEHYAGDGRMWHDTYNWELSKSQTGGKVRERSLRKDFEIEQDNIADAMAEYRDYYIMAEDHAKQAQLLKRELMTIMVNDDWFAVMSEELCRGIRYEGERVKELRNIANTIMKGECY